MREQLSFTTKLYESETRNKETYDDLSRLTTLFKFLRKDIGHKKASSELEDAHQRHEYLRYRAFCEAFSEQKNLGQFMAEATVTGPAMLPLTRVQQKRAIRDIYRRYKHLDVSEPSVKFNILKSLKLAFNYLSRRSDEDVL